jgi:hypothetical protein
MPDLLMPAPEEQRAYPWRSWSEFRAYWGEMVREQGAQPKPSEID